MDAPAIEDGLNVTILLPCHNQAATIERVVRGFAEAIPTARILVFDNNSTDDTARLATRAGARVYREARQGTGNVVRRMFADVDSDIYVLADPSRGYDPADAPSLVNALITERVDMVVGTRDNCAPGNGFGAPRDQRPLGDRSFDLLYRQFFGGAVKDLASGYRAFTRRFVRSFPAITTGFDVEIELSMHASQLMVPVAEIRLQDAASQDTGGHRTVGDRLHTTKLLAMLVKDARPFLFYSIFALVFWVVGLALMGPGLLISRDGVNASMSHELLGMAALVAGFILAGCGLILDALGRSRVEQKRILFLTVPSLGAQ
jgi:glycosyltransferase involved in cell wall biosynthesis